MNYKNVMLDFMSGDQTWKRTIRLRTQATYIYEKKNTLINYIDVNEMSNIYKLTKLCPDNTHKHIIKCL